MVCKYQLDFTPPTLYRIAAIQVSKHIWAREDTKKLITIQVNESLKAYREDSSHNKDGYPCFVGRFYSQQAEKIFPHVESKLVLLEIPKEVINELKTIAKSMGLFLIEWLTNISGVEGWPLVECRLFLDYVHWTFTGNIDTAKTLEAMYYARILPNSVRTWIQLSDHCLEDCLLDFASKLSPSLCAEYSSEVRGNIYEPKQYLMAAYWLSTLRDPNNNCYSLKRMLEFYEFCHNKQPLEENMFLSSVHTGNYYATKYFWKFLNETQKRKVMNMIYNYEVDDIARIDIIINMDLFIFLWNQFCMLTEHNYLPLLLDEYSIGRKLINWPWQEIFTKTFENASKHGFNHADYEIIMHYMLEDIVVEYKRKGIYNKFREIFKNLWKNCPANLRSTFDLDGFLIELTYHEDAETIDMIINDPALAITRDSFLFMVAQEWIDSNPSASFENAFFTRVLRDEEEREMFRKECLELDFVGDASESDDEDVEEEESTTE